MKMRESLMVTGASFALMGIASMVLAASGGKAEGSGILVIFVLTFGALIIAFQLIPGVVLLVSMIKGMFGKEKGALPLKKAFIKR